MSSRAPSSRPLVSIGVPVYNEARFIGDALASLLAQDYPNIEIIVSDNASSDGTADICRRMAALDGRIRVLTSETNDGATANFQRCLDEARGMWFLWAGGHDLWSPDMVSECVAALEAHSGAVVAIPESCWVDVSGRPFGERAGVFDTRGMDPLGRIFSLLWSNMHPMYGLMDIKALRATGPIPNYPGADLVMLARLVLQGDFVPARNALWSRRQTRPNETFKDRQRRYGGSQFRIRSGMFPMVRLAHEFLASVWASGLALPDKLAFTVAFPGLLPARHLVGRRRVG